MIEIQNPYSISPKQMMKYVLDQIPDLQYYGVDQYLENDDEKRKEPFLNKPDDFIRAVNWIRENLIKWDKMNLSINSYELKHLMQWDVGLYVSNGMFICAMISEMYKVRMNDGFNPNFNIRVKSINTIKKRIH